MRPMQKIFALALVLLLAATVYGLVQTAQPLHAPGTRNASGTTAVDQTPILTALKLAKMPRSEDEQPFAEQALETADRDMDVAYAAAKRELEEHPAPLSAEAKQIQARLKQAEDALAADGELVERPVDTRRRRGGPARPGSPLPRVEGAPSNATAPLAGKTTGGLRGGGLFGKPQGARSAVRGRAGDGGRFRCGACSRRPGNVDR